MTYQSHMARMVEIGLWYTLTNQFALFFDTIRASQGLFASRMTHLHICSFQVKREGILIQDLENNDILIKNYTLGLNNIKLIFSLNPQFCQVDSVLK